MIYEIMLRWAFGRDAGFVDTIIPDIFITYRNCSTAN